MFRPTTSKAVRSAAEGMKAKRGFGIAGVLAVGVALVVSGCSSASTLSGASSKPAASTAITVGSAGFTENTILAQIYGQALAAKGFTVSYKPNIGERPVVIKALKAGNIDVEPDYSGSLLSFLDNTAAVSSSSDVNAALAKALPSTLKMLTPASAADSDSLNVTPEYAAAHNLKSIEDLKNVGSFTLGANQQFLTRPDGIPGLEKVYGLTGVNFTAINDGGGDGTLKALLDNTIQVADIYSTTPSILANKLVTLTDPKNQFASQEVVPIVNAKKYSSKLASVLNAVSAKLTTADLLELNSEVSGDTKTQPDVAAKNWLTKAGLL